MYLRWGTKCIASVKLFLLTLIIIPFWMFGDRMNNPISPFEKWRLETIPQVGFTPEIRELLAMAFEGGRQSVLKENNHESIYK